MKLVKLVKLWQLRHPKLWYKRVSDHREWLPR